MAAWSAWSKCLVGSSTVRSASRSVTRLINWQSSSSSRLRASGRIVAGRFASDHRRERRSAKPRRARIHIGPWRFGSRERIALAQRHVQVSQSFEILHRLDALGADHGSDAAGVADQRVDHGCLRRIRADTRDEPVVELQDVRLEAHHLSKSRVSRTEIVHRKLRSAQPELVKAILEGRTLGYHFVFGQLEGDHRKVVLIHQRLELPRLQRGRTHIDRKPRAGRTAWSLELRPRGSELELDAQAGAMSLREP